MAHDPAKLFSAALATDEYYDNGVLIRSQNPFSIETRSRINLRVDKSKRAISEGRTKFAICVGGIYWDEAGRCKSYTSSTKQCISSQLTKYLRPDAFFVDSLTHARIQSLLLKLSLLNSTPGQTL